MKNRLKRIFDYALALGGLVLSLPLWIVFGFLVWLEDKGPVFYFQERVGRDCRIFKSVKFRSMVQDAERATGPIQAQEDDQRITKVGRFLRAAAMDELPQLWNILKGDMSFVGPRALRLVEIENKEGRPSSMQELEGFLERASVRPGLTGIAQVLAPRYIPRSEKFIYDIWYVRNWNLWLDIMIIICSFLISFAGKWERSSKPRFDVLNRWGIKIESEV